MQQQVRAEEVTIHQVEKEHEVKVQDAEILRRDRELTATVLKPAEYERKRIETLAEAEKQRLIMEAEGQASAIRAQGEAEAEIIFKKGDAEARAMNVKAEAYQQFNQAAIVDKLITNMPEIVRPWPRRWPTWTRSPSSPPATPGPGALRRNAGTPPRADGCRWRLHQSRLGRGGGKFRSGLLWIVAGELEARRTRCPGPQRRVPGQRLPL